jgi:small conductance mechanosensitive channel
MDLARLNQDLAALANEVLAWLAGAAPNIIAALVLLGAGWWVAGLAARAISHVIDTQPYVDPTLKGVLTRLARWGLIVITVVAVLSQLGVSTTSLLAALGAIGLAVGLALQGTLANIAAGIMILWLRPFRVGDDIAAGDVSGTVTEVGLFASTLKSFEGVFLFVPNSDLWDKRIANYTRSSPRMVRLTFSIAYGDDIARARRALLEVAEGDARVLAEPAPGVWVNQLGDSSVALELHAWTGGSDWAGVRFDVIERGKLALQAAGITIPFPQRDVHVKDMPQGANPPEPKKRKSAA